MSFGPLSLTVRDLDAMLPFYEKELGLKVKLLDDHIVELRPSVQSPEPLIILRHDPRAEKPPPDAAGLYHYALLVPNRESLAAAYLSLGKSGIVFDGYADHMVSEALYLTDPERNGIEIYSDRPRDEWKFDEDHQVLMATNPLDIDSMLTELSGTSQDGLKAIADGTRIGHIHLKVTQLGRSVEFYRQVLGMDLMSYWGSAAFLSVGGYHHHIGMNTWESLGGPAMKTGWSGLEHFTLEIPKKQFDEIAPKLIDSPLAHVQDHSKLLIPDPDGIEMTIKTT